MSSKQHKNPSIPSGAAKSTRKNQQVNIFDDEDDTIIKDNPFSFFAFDEKNIKDSFPIPGTTTTTNPTKKGGSAKKQIGNNSIFDDDVKEEVILEDNPFSFFTAEEKNSRRKNNTEDILPPPPVKVSSPLPQKKEVLPPPPPSSIASLPLPGTNNSNNIKNKKQINLPPPEDSLVEESPIYLAMKKRAEDAEAELEKYDHLLSKAKQKFTELREREKKEVVEMSDALRLIEKNLETMKIRAEKAENQVLHLQQKLQQQKSSFGQAEPDQNLAERTQYALNLMYKISTDGQNGMNLLLNGIKDFNLLMETLKYMNRVSSTDG